MPSYLLILFGVLISLTTKSQEPIPAIASFSTYSSLLKDKKVGIVGNHTSTIGSTHSIDFLYKNKINIVRIFCPEHGFRGTADAGETIGDYIDPKTKLPVISLYGKKKKPLPEEIKDLDIIIFDIQDVGIRFYTYISTLHYVMEAAAEQDIPVLVMDRPNPNAFYIDGPVLDMQYNSFVGMHPVPIVYGMTIGEYAQMINGEGWLKNNIKCNLKIIPCKNWNRDQIISLKQAPSPNLPDSISIMLYPSVCLFEGTEISEGRGTQTPFQLFGHPDLKNMPFTFTPISIDGMSKYPKCENKLCYGMDLRDKYNYVKEGKQIRLEWLISAYKNYQGSKPFFNNFFNKLAGNDILQKDIKNGKTENEIRDRWQKDLHTFSKIRKKYLIY